MRNAEHNASPATPPKTGLLASLCARLHAKGSGAPSSRRVAVTLAALATALGALAFTAAPALAAQGHAFTSSFSGEPGTHLTNPWGIDVDGAAGVVLVADSSNHRVAKFDLSGAPLEFSGLASNELTGVGAPEGFGTVDSVVDVPSGVDAGDVYVVDYEHNVVDLFNAKGEYVSQLTGAATPQETTPQGAFSTPFAVAVAPATGDVWVLDSGHDTVDEFEPEEAGKKFKYLTQIEAATLGEPLSALQGIALDAAGDVYVAGFNEPAGHFQIDKFKANGVYEGVLDPNGGTSVAVDTSTTPNDVYVLEGGGLAISRFEATSTTGIPSEQFAAPGGRELQDIAVDSSTHSVYATNYTDSQVDIFTAGETPEAPLTEPAKPIQATTATLRGQLNPGGATGKLEYRFDYNQGASCTGGQSVPVPNGEASEAKNAPVEASVTGLQRATQYTYCLLAINPFGSTRGNPVTFTTFAEAPKIEEQSVTDVSATAATFSATVNPGAATTTYTFEYAPTGGAYTPVAEPAGSGSIPAGIEGVPLSVHVQHGLAPDTSYEFRLVARNAIETVTGKPVSFTTQHPGGELVLPDGRQYEMVTPPDKHGALFLYGEPARIQASVHGDAIIDEAGQPSESEPEGYNNQVDVLSTRGPSGWSSQSLQAPRAQSAGPKIFGGPEYHFFSADLSGAVLEPAAPFLALSPWASEQTPFLRADYLNGNPTQHCEASYLSAGSCFKPLVSGCPAAPAVCSPSVEEHADVPRGTEFGEEFHGQCDNHLVCGPRFVDATPDLSHVVLGSCAALTSNATPISAEGCGTGSPPGFNYYEWSGGQLQLLPGPLAGVEGGASGLSLALGTQHAISQDGQRVLLGGAGGPIELYDTNSLSSGDPHAQTTVEVGVGVFQTASADDSRVFFTAASGDLYEYDLEKPEGERVTDLTTHAGEPAEVQGVLGASEDGSYVYFTAQGALTSDADPSLCKTQGPNRTPQQEQEADTCNVYLRHDGVTTLIAAAGPVEADASEARVSPDGRWLAFMSDKDLTHYDTRDAVSGKLDQEVYLYSADANKLVCASCDPTGARPIGFGPVGASENEVNILAYFMGLAGRLHEAWIAASVPTWSEFEPGKYQPRYLSNGGRLFFDSISALAPQDTNGNVDVYQYEPAGFQNAEGIPQCTGATATFSELPTQIAGAKAGGCVSLISSGTSSTGSVFLDASENGSDAFFFSTAKLVETDKDTAVDVYDAHECTTASPCTPPAAAAPEACNNEASCKASPTPQPSIFGPSGSATFSGQGNITPTPPVVTKKTVKCPRGKKLSRGRCVKAKAKHRKKAHKARKASHKGRPRS